jgi:hypothetical protein
MNEEMRTLNVQHRTSNVQRASERTQAVRRSVFSVRRSAFAFLLALCLLPSAFSAAAQPTQEDVLRSISQNVNESADGGKVLAVVAGLAGVILLLAVLQQRKSREVRPKSVQHPGRLIKEVMKTVPLRPAEFKQLKMLVERKRESGERDELRVESPLTLILCPSVLVKAIKNPPAKLDRKVIAQLARKLGTQPATAPARST